MAVTTVVDETTLRLKVELADAVAMIQEAASDIAKYAVDIVTIYEKMPLLDYKHFCFYAFDSAALFEQMLGIDPKQYLYFSLDAPDAFFYALYGGMAGLYEKALRCT